MRRHIRGWSVNSATVSGSGGQAHCRIIVARRRVPCTRLGLCQERLGRLTRRQMCLRFSLPLHDTYVAWDSGPGEAALDGVPARANPISRGLLEEAVRLIPLRHRPVRNKAGLFEDAVRLIPSLRHRHVRNKARSTSRHLTRGPKLLVLPPRPIIPRRAPRGRAARRRIILTLKKHG